MKLIPILTVALLCGYLVKQHFGIPEGPGMPRTRVPEADMAKFGTDYPDYKGHGSGAVTTAGICSISSTGTWIQVGNGGWINAGSAAACSMGMSGHDTMGSRTITYSAPLPSPPPMIMGH